jgi:hypothetical protein
MPRFQSPLSTNSQSYQWTHPPWHWGVMSIPWALLYMSFQIPRKEPPLTELPQREMLPFRSPPTISKNSQSTDSPGTPTGHYRERHPSPTLSSTPFPQSPSKWAPPPCSPTGSLWREKLHLQRLWFIHSFLSVRVPNKEPSHKKGEKYLVTIHRAPRGWKAYIQSGAAWFPKGIVFNTAISTPVPCTL